MCQELKEYSSDTYANDSERDYTDAVTGVTLLRDDVATARTEEMVWYDKEEVADETCVSRTGRKPICCRWRDINKGYSERVEVRSRLVARRNTTGSTHALRDKQGCDEMKDRVDDNSRHATPTEHSYMLTH